MRFEVPWADMASRKRREMCIGEEEPTMAGGCVDEHPFLYADDDQEACFMSSRDDLRVMKTNICQTTNSIDLDDGTTATTGHFTGSMIGQLFVSLLFLFLFQQTFPYSYILTAISGNCTLSVLSSSFDSSRQTSIRSCPRVFAKSGSS
jgi:hypothetical protein